MRLQQKCSCWLVQIGACKMNRVAVHYRKLFPRGPLCMISHKDKEIMTDDEFFNSCNENETESEELDDILTDEERRQLEAALKMDPSDANFENGDGIIAHRHSCYEQREIPIEDANGCVNGDKKQERKGWFSGWRRWDGQ